MKIVSSVGARAPFRVVASRLLFFSALLLLTLPSARANMAERRPATRPGDAAREASGGRLGSIHIERETLVIDLRPVERSRPAVVEATYRVRNDGAERTLPLVFVATALAPTAEGEAVWTWGRRGWTEGPGRAPSEADASGVWLDGRAVEVSPATDRESLRLPDAWGPPATTPALEAGAEPLPYEAAGAGPFVYTLTLAPGAHTIRVRYEARPSAYCDAKTDAVYWQLGYVLAPAREWASFGGLDAKVLVPEGWQASASLPMRREGDALTASWDGLPADSLALTARTDERAVEDAGIFWTTFLIVGGLMTAAAVYAGWRFGRWVGTRRRTSAWGLLALPPACAALVALSAAVAQLVARPGAPEQACFNMVGNYNFIITFFIAATAFTLHFIAAQTTAFIARRRK